MPLTTRSVSPVDLSIRRLPASVQQDELQCVANGTVANLIRQLSSISRHAEQTFSEIHREVLKIDHRTNTLFLRVERLSQKVSQQSQSSNNLRGVADQASLEDAALRKAFKSCNIIDQHSLSRQTLPSSLQEQYQRCDAPPQLNQLNPYREDEKQALRYYTDPGYFFELWRQEILKGCNVEKKRTGRSPTSPSRQHRRQKEQQQQQQQQHQHLSQQQQNVLLNYHASSRSSDYTRFVAPQNQPAGTSRHQQRVHHHQQQQHGGGMLPNSAAEIMHFPAEYQAPQALLASREFMQPPPGMSVVGGGGELTPTLGQQNYNQQPMFRQNTDGIAAPSNEQQLPQQQGHNIAFHQMDAQMGQMGVAGAMAFLDDDDDELPPPPPQTILGSAAFAQHSSPAAASSDSPSLPSAAGDGVQLPMEANNHHTIQNVPPPPPPPPQQPAAAGVQFRQKIPPAVSSAIPAPPPPPPPPPPANFAAKKINAATIADGNKTFAGEEEGQNVQRKPSTTSNGTNQGNRSQLLVQIQEGVKLKKVKQEEELAEKRAVATSDDVAAILRKRMEHCLGESDSSSSSAGGSPTADDNEWDD